MQARPSSQWSNSLLGGVTGALLGVMIAYIVNATLAEISVSAFFSVYFGVLFFVVGCIILWRVLQPGYGPKSKRVLMIVLGGVVLFSGCLCFVLEKNWFTQIGSATKIPLYATLGIAVSFALTFAIVDGLNYLAQYCGNAFPSGVVETAEQVYLVLGTSLLMGLCFGFVFGLMDVEDEQSYRLHLALMREEYYCYPIGFISGGLCGFFNEKLRRKEVYEELATSAFNDEI
mmetsp:Transcript_6489/g.11352  ORF Transcript_6489/g.11352 Transcript_6489/m.11352 type:complete len:230 (-) Transcript_6489:57-746(-)